MKIEEYERSDGTKGEIYLPEVGDEFVSRYAEPRIMDRAGVKKDTGKAILIKDCLLGVTTKDGKEIALRVTYGQAKALLKAGDITGKTIKFVNYVHKDWGALTGVKVM